MLSFRVTALLAVAAFSASPPTPLQVLRTAPADGASPTARIEITFDRPVAGSLDQSVDPAAIFRIDPAVAGRLEWRDPVTLRLTPARPLKPGTSYTVTIAPSFEAMDASRLAEPFHFSFSVSGPRVLGGLPVSADEHPQFLAPDVKFELVFSSPVEPETPQGLAYLDFNQACRASGIIRLKVTGQRAITDKDPWQYREAGGWERDHGADSLRRVVSLTTERKLPLDCAGELVVPSTLDPEGTSPFVRWSFRAYGPFKVVRAVCGGEPSCPTGGVRLEFSTPVRGEEVLRRVKLLPETPFSVADSSEEQANWYLETTLTPHTGYAVVADTAIKDVFGQSLEGNPVTGFKTTGYAPLVDYEYGRMTIERAAFRTLAVKYVNVDTLTTLIAPVPDSLLPAVLRYNSWNRDDTTMSRLLAKGTTQAVAVAGEKDRVRIYGVKLPVYNAGRPGSPLLQLVKVTSPALDSSYRANLPVAIVQVTDLGVHAKIGVSEGAVWVTGASDGRPKAGASVVLYDSHGAPRARAATNADGMATLTGFRPDTTKAGDESDSFEGYVIATLGNDRALTPINQYDPDLNPWQFNVRSVWGGQRYPAAAAVFTERGIYRPGEAVYAKAILRSGPLGQLRVPAKGDSAHWIFTDREGGTLREKTVALSAFGTTDQSVTIPEGAPLGAYAVKIQQKQGGRWLDLGQAGYRVAEYRPPEFLVDVTADSTARFPGDSFSATIEARYLFGAPMGRAQVRWTAKQIPVSFWELTIPGTDGYFLGENGWWWEEDNDRGPGVQVTGSGTDTLDQTGHRTLKLAIAEPSKGRPARATLEATVTDVNRQTVSASASVLVHPAAFYLGAKPLGKSYFWTQGVPAEVAVIAVRPDGSRVPNVAIKGTIVRREWHRVHRDRAGYSEVYGEWVADTVGRCTLTSQARDPASCRFTPPGGGTYIVSFEATDADGRAVSTSLYRWATGRDWVPWNDESQFKMDVVPDQTRYSVGDTATVLFASPFTDADAWVTVEREGLIEQRRIRLAAGSTTLKFPVTEAYAPNVFVSVLVARGRSAPPGPLDDPGRPTIRVGYAELRVTPEVKRLTVEVAPALKEYRPGDTARVQLRVKDRTGKGQRSEVTLWAVDEGVLSLTGYQTPDPIDLLYSPRGLGLKLASNLTTVAPQVPEGEKGGRAPGGGGGLGESDILRSRFKTTAFFLGSVVTDSAGNALARAKLPDNLTTFRVMAVAVTAGDRYGNGQSPLLVTRPLLARPALPRFLREGDRFSAGVVVNQRAGGTPTVEVQAEARGATLAGAASRSAELEAGRGREVRFDFTQPGDSPLGEADSSTFRFKVTGAGDADLVQQRLPIKPAYWPRSQTVAGVLTDTATAEFTLPAGLDLDRSRLMLSLGSSPLGIIRAVNWELRIYSYYCTEQVSSSAQPLIALYRAQKALGKPLLPGDPKREIEKAVSMLSRRQRPDGGIGYWSADDWTTPWLSALAGLTLLDARSAGVAVDDSVLARLAGYLSGAVNSPQPIRAPVIGWYDSLRTRLSDQVAAVDFLSRLKRPDVAAENELLRNAPQLAWEDRVRLAEVLSRRKAVKAARALLQPVWRGVKVEGRRAVVPDSALPRFHYFYSRIRPTARLLTATLAVDSANALIGPLMETLVQQGKAGILDYWNTQDYSSLVGALVAFDRRTRAAAARPFTITAPSGARLTDSTVALKALVGGAQSGSTAFKLTLAAGAPGGPIYYYLTVREVPSVRPVTPDDRGIQVERWYERMGDKSPLVSVAEGELVRVRLRIRVPTDREFVVLDDPLPAGLEAIDLSLRTVGGVPGPGIDQSLNYLGGGQQESEGEGEAAEGAAGMEWYYGSWDAGWWSPFDHKELRDDRVVYFATVLWKGTYTATYLARATTPGVFIRPPAHAEEMYNPAVSGRSDGGVFTVTPK